MKSLLALLLLSLLVGCGGGGGNNYARSAYGTVGGYSLANAQPKPLSLMVARKIERPLYLVLDDSRVKNTWPISTAECVTGQDGCEHFKILDAQLFVTRDLKGAMEPYFSRVEVVRSRDELPKTPHVVGDVKIDDMRLTSLVRGAFTYRIVEMRWGFAMRPDDSEEYIYSFAGQARSNDTYRTFEEGLGQLVDNAIGGMLEKWTDGDGIKALRAVK